MKIAVSSCLLGEKIRFDGGHKHNRFITNALSKFSEFIPFCPEHLAFGTPRATIRLVNEANNIEVYSSKGSQKLTQTLITTSQLELEKLKSIPLSAIIFKSKSPSCGLNSTIVYRTNGYAEKKESGLFAKMCQEHFPLLPMEEEGRLQDPWLRENFMMQLFAYDDFQTFKASNPQMKELVHFHQVYKFMLQSKDERGYRKLGQIVGNQQKRSFEQIFLEYELQFKRTIATKSSIKKTRNVLEHMAGFLKHHLSPIEKEMLHEQIKEYSQKIVPLIAPLSRILMFATNYNNSYLLNQKFLHPYPKELALRSDIKSGK